MMGSLEQVESCHTEGHTLMFGTQRSILGQVRRFVIFLMLVLMLMLMVMLMLMLVFFSCCAH